MSIATLISTLATTITLLTGLIVFWRQIRDREKEQVSKVAAWLHTINHEDGSRDIVFMLQNDSSQPIYNVTLEVSVIPHDDKSVTLGPSGQPYRDTVLSNYWYLLSPGFREILPEIGLYDITSKDGWSLDIEQQFYGMFSFNLAMTDVKGRRWSRDERGLLKRIAIHKKFPRVRIGE